MERRLAAIVAADLVGYSRLMAEDEAGTITAVSNLIAATVEPLVSRHGGRIVKLMGEYQLSIDVLESMLKLPIFYVHQQIAIAYAQLGNTGGRAIA